MLRRNNVTLVVGAMVALALCAGSVMSVDWPQWRYDAAHTAISPETLPAGLTLQWVREYPAPEAAWDAQKEVYCYGGQGERVQQKCSYDIAYQPVVAGNTVVFGSPNNDRVTALDLVSGEELWHFYADGPVRLAPVAKDGHVIFGADDGVLYCLDITNGSVAWKFGAELGSRKVLGNDRLISMWPVRGAPVLDGDIMYFGVGIYAFEGAVVYAVDVSNVTSPVLVWKNSKDYMKYTVQPHSRSDGYNGIAPQGYLCVAQDDKLLVPNGRARPACLNTNDGSLEFFRLWRGWSVSKNTGGYHVVAAGDRFYCRDTEFDLANGDQTSNPGQWYPGAIPAQYDEWTLQIEAGGKVYSAVENLWEEDRLGNRSGNFHLTGDGLSATVDGMPYGLLAANDHLLATTVTGKIYCYGEGEPEGGATTWEYDPIAPNPGNQWENTARQILSGAGYEDGSNGVCVVAGLRNGRLAAALAMESDITVVAFEENGALVDKIRADLDECGLYGRKVHIINEHFMDAECPPHMAHVITSELRHPARDYAMTSGDSGDRQKRHEAFVKEVFEVLRPYGGTAAMRMAPGLAGGWLDGVPNAEIGRSRGYTLISKVGKLPGSDDWTHQFCDASQSNASGDELVKLPLGVLWFGGSRDNTNDEILPRHGHGPSPQVVGGRYYVEGRDVLRCVDAYTGRVLWEKTISNLGQFSDYTDHQSGQIGIGDNYIATEEAVYVLGTHLDNDWPTECLVLNPATGAEINTYTLPNQAGWGMIAVCEDYLIAAGNPLIQDDHGYDNDGNPFPQGSGWIYQDSDPLVGVGGMGTFNGTTSENLYVLSRGTGQVMWQKEADYGFFHNSVVAGNGKLFAIDRKNWDESMTIEERMEMDESGVPHKSSGSAPESGVDHSLDKDAVLYALRLADGSSIWEKSEDVFGTWLAYSKQHDKLVECYRGNRDYLEEDDPMTRMAVHEGATGDLVWAKIDEEGWSYEGGPVMLLDEAIVCQEGYTMDAVNLLTGEKYQYSDPLTGNPREFHAYTRYGCGHKVACPNAIFYRSGSAGYFDLKNMSGAGNFGGFKTACTINMMPANGLLVCPEYTKTCGCSYQVQTSCALVHMPETEVWTNNRAIGLDYQAEGGRLRDVGFNFGAPGDRVDEAIGLMWMDYPQGEYAATLRDEVGSYGDDGPYYPEWKYDFRFFGVPVDVTVDGTPEYFRMHSAEVSGGTGDWVAASGVQGASAITIDMVGDAHEYVWDEASESYSWNVTPVSAPAASYDVYLVFVEPDEDAQPGDRVFSVSVEGVSTGAIDVAAEAGVKKVLLKQLRNVVVDDALDIQLNASEGASILCGIGLKCKE